MHGKKIKYSRSHKAIELRDTIKSENKHNKKQAHLPHYLGKDTLARDYLLVLNKSDRHYVA
ncbi:hypothetical protein GCM10008022_13400 [Paenibacillus hunanensis]|nr:hypothetical protein GCM10008022_13400 [Paenibacillus hunanensis]